MVAGRREKQKRKSSKRVRESRRQYWRNLRVEVVEVLEEMEKVEVMAAVEELMVVTWSQCRWR